MTTSLPTTPQTPQTPQAPEAPEAQRAQTAAPKNEPRHAPMRTCVGCRRPSSKIELLRVTAPIILQPGRASEDVNNSVSEIILDERQRLPGRGAYVHRDARCIDAAVHRGGFSRSFKRRVRASALQQFMRSREEGQS